MTRSRKNAPSSGPTARTRRRGESEAVTRIRRRAAEATGPIELTPEELEALDDAGITPEDLLRVTLAHSNGPEEVSPHDRDTPRDDLEGLLTEAEEDYG